MAREIKLGNSLVGLDRPTYFIADIAANHDGSLERAIDLIYQCADAGANAAKFQNFKASSIVSDHGFKNLGDQLSHQKTWSKSVFEVYQDASLPPEWSEELRKSCANAGIDYLTAPYDIGFVKELSKYVCAWKLGSGDITWHESISAMASDGKPLLIATGASDMEDVRMAMNIATEHTD
ncbi:MAG: N-acetylneuraminate synthase family protein, partial [Opitutae bacterium]